jgi:hypothetical protein
MTALTRLDGWENRLADVVAGAHSQPYRLGQWDCLRFTCACVEALTGVDFWPDFAGKYTTRLEALRAIASKGKDLSKALTAVIKVDPAPMVTACRGDVVLYRDDAGEHLGVCLGQDVAVLERSGLLYVPILNEHCISVWRVG